MNTIKALAIYFPIAVVGMWGPDKVLPGGGGSVYLQCSAIGLRALSIVTYDAAKAWVARRSDRIGGKQCSQTARATPSQR